MCFWLRGCSPDPLPTHSNGSSVAAPLALLGHRRDRVVDVAHLAVAPEMEPTSVERRIASSPEALGVLVDSGERLFPMAAQQELLDCFEPPEWNRVCVVLCSLWCSCRS